MSLRLEPPTHRGGVTVAVVSETRVRSARLAGGPVGFARKVPVAFLVDDGTGLSAMDLRGRRLAPDALEAACPGLIEAIRAAGAGRLS